LSAALFPNRIEAAAMLHFLQIPFGLTDVLIVFVLTAAAIIAGAYVYASHRHPQHRHDQQHPRSHVAPVWTEWVLGLVVAAVFLGVAIEYLAQA